MSNIMRQVELSKIINRSPQFIHILSSQINCPFSYDNEAKVVLKDEKTLAFIRKYRPNFGWTDFQNIISRIVKL